MMMMINPSVARVVMKWDVVQQDVVHQSSAALVFYLICARLTFVGLGC